MRVTHICYVSILFYLYLFINQSILRYQFIADSDLHLQQVNHKAILLLSYFSLVGEQISISTSPPDVKGCTHALN